MSIATARRPPSLRSVCQGISQRLFDLLVPTSGQNWSGMRSPRKSRVSQEARDSEGRTPIPLDASAAEIFVRADSRRAGVLSDHESPHAADLNATDLAARYFMYDEGRARGFSVFCRPNGAPTALRTTLMGPRAMGSTKLAHGVIEPLPC